jgi:hypothetical protein
VMNRSRLRAQRGENLLDVLGGRNEPIHPDEDWHLDHNEARDGYLGVGHASCNLAAGANKANGRRRPEPYVQQPYRWSRRWYDDPPIGTINFDGGHNPEIYVGNGEWRDAASSAVRETSYCSLRGEL